MCIVSLHLPSLFIFFVQNFRDFPVVRFLFQSRLRYGSHHLETEQDPCQDFERQTNKSTEGAERVRRTPGMLSPTPSLLWACVNNLSPSAILVYFFCSKFQRLSCRQIPFSEPTPLWASIIWKPNRILVRILRDKPTNPQRALSVSEGPLKTVSLHEGVDCHKERLTGRSQCPTGCMAALGCSFRCPTCKLGFRHESEFVRHQSKKKPCLPPGESRFYCKVCDVSFPGQARLDAHLRSSSHREKQASVPTSSAPEISSDNAAI